MLSFLKPRTKNGHPAGNIYTDAEIAAAREAVRAPEGEDVEISLAKAGLTRADVLPAVEQWAAAAQSVGIEECTIDEGPAASARPAGSSTAAVERAGVDVPAGYEDSVEERAKLIAAVWRKHGDGWQVEAFDAEQSKVYIVRGERPSMRPGAAVYEAGTKATASNGDAIAASHAAHGRTMLGYDPYRGHVETAVLPPATIELRNRLLRKDPKQKSWELELLPLFSVTDGVGHLDRVIIERVNPAAQDRIKEVAIWLGIARTVIGHEGWRVEVDAKTGRVEMIHGVRPELPRLVRAAAVIPQEIDTENWSNFVIGLNSRNEKVSIDLEAGPHSLVVGGTGSGKSVALRVIILNALARGFEVVIIDPTKQAAGLRGIEPWTKGIFIKDLEEAASALNAVYKEVRRRVDLISAVRGENWRDLPKGSVRPILVLVDEFSGVATAEKRPVGLGNDHPLMIEWVAEATAIAQIQSKIGKIAREARSAGVHLVISTQRPDASDIGGQVRENLGTILQMVVPARPPSPQALGMVFPSDYTSLAVEEIDLLNDGHSKGFALSYIEGGGLQGFRVGFVDKDDMEEYAERLGLPLGDSLVLGDREPQAFETVDQEEWHFEELPPPTPTEVDLGEIEFTMDDLTGDAPAEPSDEPDLDWGDSFTRSSVAPSAKEVQPEGDEDPSSGPPVRTKPKPVVEEFDW